MIKSILSFATLFVSFLALGQTSATGDSLIKSDVYSWENLQVEKKETSERRQILEGNGPILAHMEIHATTIDPGTAPHAPHKHPEEELFIIKEGLVKLTINGMTQLLGPGSVGVAMPGDEHGITNAGSVKATYYVIKYKSRDSVQLQRAKDAGGSFMMNANSVVFKPHGKGGIRNYFERPTAMINRFEMHVSTLNTGLKSHDPHTHKAEEIVLMIEGNAEMQIGNSFEKAAPGDLIYLGSNVLHAIRNDDTKPCKYFAFQWN